jgi:SAM-dependent methyltransferase
VNDPPPQTQPDSRQAAARAAVAANPHWYHTIELAPGVLTPGQIDLRATAPKLLPSELRGRRALDVGTFDGFWAFELARRGATTVAVDVPSLDAAEWPPNRRPELVARMRDWDVELGRGFRLAAELLEPVPERIECSIYDLDSRTLGGAFDLVFVGALLVHLRDPVRGLERVHDVLEPGGELILLETFSVADTLRSPRRPVAAFQPLKTQFNWWHANISALKAWLWTAGFSDVKLTGLHRPPAQRPTGGPHASLRARRR